MAGAAPTVPRLWLGAAVLGWLAAAGARRRGKGKGHGERARHRAQGTGQGPGHGADQGLGTGDGPGTGTRNGPGPGTRNGPGTGTRNGPGTGHRERARDRDTERAAAERHGRAGYRTGCVPQVSLEQAELCACQSRSCPCDSALGGKPAERSSRTRAAGSPTLSSWRFSPPCWSTGSALAHPYLGPLLQPCLFIVSHFG